MIDFLNKFVDFFTNHIMDKIISMGIRMLFVVIIFIVGSRLIKFTKKLLKKTLERANAERGVVQFVTSFTSTALYVLLILLIATNLGVEPTSLVALIGSAGVTIGLAIQGSLSNLAGGVLILLLKPFVVGDYIIENNTGMEGTVDEIQIFYTRLLTADNRIVILPNGTLANNSIINATAAHIRRLDIFVGVSYDSDILKTKEVLLGMLEGVDTALKDHERAVFVNELADSSISMGVRCYVLAENYWTTKWEITEKIKLTLDKAGIEIPFPQLSVHMRNNSK